MVYDHEKVLVLDPPEHREDEPLCEVVVGRRFGRLAVCGKPAPYLILPTDADPLGCFCCAEHIRRVD